MREQERIKAGVATESELNTAKASAESLAGAIEAFTGALRAKRRDPDHVAKTGRYLERAKDALGWSALADMDGESLIGWIADENHGARVAGGEPL